MYYVDVCLVKGLARCHAEDTAPYKDKSLREDRAVCRAYRSADGSTQVEGGRPISMATFGYGCKCSKRLSMNETFLRIPSVRPVPAILKPQINWNRMHLSCDFSSEIVAIVEEIEVGRHLLFSGLNSGLKSNTRLGSVSFC